MADMWIAIEEMLRDGADVQTVAQALHVPVEWVIDIYDSMGADEPR